MNSVAADSVLGVQVAIPQKSYVAVLIAMAIEATLKVRGLTKRKQLHHEIVKKFGGAAISGATFNRWCNAEIQDDAFQNSQVLNNDAEGSYIKITLEQLAQFVFRVEAIEGDRLWVMCDQTYGDDWQSLLKLDLLVKGEICASIKTKILSAHQKTEVISLEISGWHFLSAVFLVARLQVNATHERILELLEAQGLKFSILELEALEGGAKTPPRPSLLMGLLSLNYVINPVEDRPYDIGEIEAIIRGDVVPINPRTQEPFTLSELRELNIVRDSVNGFHAPG